MSSSRDARDERKIIDMAAHLLAVEPAFSRNKHYDAFRDPSFKRALMLYRRIKALTADIDAALDRGMDVTVVDGVWGGQAAKQLSFRSAVTRRVVWLPLSAWQLLRQRCPRVDEISS
jgi:hypothetical protein